MKDADFQKLLQDMRGKRMSRDQIEELVKGVVIPNLIMVGRYGEPDV